MAWQFMYTAMKATSISAVRSSPGPFRAAAATSRPVPASMPAPWMPLPRATVYRRLNDRFAAATAGEVAVEAVRVAVAAAVIVAPDGWWEVMAKSSAGRLARTSAWRRLSPASDGSPYGQLAAVGG